MMKNQNIRDREALLFKISILGYCFDVIIDKGKEKKVTLYQISVSTAVNNWKVKHRFNDFYNLHELLSKNYTKLPKMPQKSIFALTSKQQLEKRKIDLEQYLIELLKLELITHNVYFVQFLKIDSYFKDSAVHPPQVMLKYETLNSLIFTDISYLEGRIVNYVLCSKGINKPSSNGDTIKAPIDSSAQNISKSILNGFKFYKDDPVNIFQDKKILKSFDLKAHCLRYFEEAAILVVGFSQGIVVVYKEEKKNKLDDEYQLEPVARFRAMSDRVTSILINTIKGEMYVLGRKNQIKVVDMATWTVKGSAKLGSNSITAFQIEENSGLGIATTVTGELLVINLDGQTPVLSKHIPVSYPHSISCMDCDIDSGKVMCGVSDSGNIILIDIEFPFNSV